LEFDMMLSLLLLGEMSNRCARRIDTAVRALASPELRSAVSSGQRCGVRDRDPPPRSANVVENDGQTAQRRARLAHARRRREITIAARAL
jgi:hypothetical protein